MSVVCAPPTYVLGVKRYDQLRRALDSISRRYQREAHEDKHLLAYSNLLQVVAPSDFPLKAKKVRPGAIYELVKIGAERSTFSRGDRQAAISIIKADKAEIAKTDADELLALRADIEKITLGSLIQKFEDMLSKDLTEPKWQEFLKSNSLCGGRNYSRCGREDRRLLACPTLYREPGANRDQAAQDETPEGGSCRGASAAFGSVSAR